MTSLKNHKNLKMWKLRAKLCVNSRVNLVYNFVDIFVLKFYSQFSKLFFTLFHSHFTDFLTAPSPLFQSRLFHFYTAPTITTTIYINNINNN